MIKHLQVETTNICNAHCVFCPHDRFEKSQLGIMSDELYRKIVEDAAQYNLISFIPMLTGEPFCDPDIIERIRLARELMPSTFIRLFTNGSLMKREHINELSRIKGFQVNISINGHNQERRLELMGLNDFDHVKNIISRMIELNMDFNLTSVWHPVYSVEQINEFIKLPRSNMMRFQSFAGKIYPYRRLSPTRCSRITEYMTVLWTGQVNLCCFDPFGEVNFGDLNHQTIEEVWNSREHIEYLEAHEQYKGQEMPLCRNCTEGA